MYLMEGVVEEVDELNIEDIPTASHSPKGEWQHMRFTVDTVPQDREGSTHLL